MSRCICDVEILGHWSCGVVSLDNVRIEYGYFDIVGEWISVNVHAWLPLMVLLLNLNLPIDIMIVLRSIRYCQFTWYQPLLFICIEILPKDLTFNGVEEIAFDFILIRCIVVDLNHMKIRIVDHQVNGQSRIVLRTKIPSVSKHLLIMSWYVPIKYSFHANWWILDTLSFGHLTYKSNSLFWCHCICHISEIMPWVISWNT